VEKFHQARYPVIHARKEKKEERKKKEWHTKFPPILMP